MTKQKIVKIACNEVLVHGVEQINIKNLANRTGFNIEKLNTLFQYGDQELLMDAVEYAGKVWVSQIKKKIQDSHNISDKLKILANSYTMGSKDFSQSLSTYIDLWKIVKDQKDEYIKTRLKSIYNFYISEFVNIATDIGCRNIPKKELNSFADDNFK